MTKLPAAIHAELLASVFATIVPSVVMSVMFAATGVFVAADAHDPWLHGLLAAGLLASAVRLAVMISVRAQITAVTLGTPAAARTIERRFAASYLAFAIVLGLFAARAIAILPDGLAIIVAVLVVGYAAGVSTGTAFRPAIAVSSMLVAVIPAIVVVAFDGTGAHAMLALLLSGLLGGGIHSTLVRYRAAVREHEIRHVFATLARSDPLTGLPNRLALTEHLVATGAGAVIHCIDLDDFKPINDTHGHPVGDAMLYAIAGRLTGLLGDGDVAARLGGDEFVVVRAPDREPDTDGFALRLTLALSEPVTIGDIKLSVGASVGSAVLLPDDDPNAAIARADRALYDAKRAGHARDHAPDRPGAIVARA